jgi:putative glutamine amidotransferase
MSRLPLIGVTACTKQIGLHPFHIAGDKYARAILEGAGSLPLVIPALGSALDQAALLETLDGLLLPGSPSNIEPHRYQGLPPDIDTPSDPARDDTTLPLIRAAVAAGIPVLGICRGFQEFNVAFGGTLHQKVHQVPGLHDHREPLEQPVEVQYAPRHPVTIQPGGLLEACGLPPRIQVNSLHGQGVERVGPGLRIEALSDDGLVEALSLEGSPAFALGVQWHPEWQVTNNPDYLAIFQAFGEACRKKAGQR